VTLPEALNFLSIMLPASPFSPPPPAMVFPNKASRPITGASGLVFRKLSEDDFSFLQRVPIRSVFCWQVRGEGGTHGFRSARRKGSSYGTGVKPAYKGDLGLEVRRRRFPVTEQSLEPHDLGRPEQTPPLPPSPLINSEVLSSSPGEEVLFTNPVR